jgi:hypothetical protein
VLGGNTSVNWKRGILFLLILIIVELFFFRIETFAQMRTAYPKRFSLYGFVELKYNDYSVTTSSHRNSYSVLTQRYSVGIKGYVYDPRLIVFSAKATFTDIKTLESTSPLIPKSKNMTYEFNAKLLPYRPVSLSIYYMRSDFTYDGLNNYTPHDSTINNYGALLGINLKKFPLIRFEYYHLDITDFQQNDKVTSNDNFYLLIQGNASKLKTQYSISLGLTYVNNVYDSFTTKLAEIYARTSFKKFYLTNFARYSEQELSKNYGIYTDLVFNQGYRFNHDYSYSYEHFEDTYNGITQKSEKQEIKGFFSYKILYNLLSSISLNYGKINFEGDESKYHALSASLNYSRQIKKLYLVSFYRFYLRDDELKGNSKAHTIHIDLTTRQLKWGGRIFAAYYFEMLDGTFKFTPDSEDLNLLNEEPMKGNYDTKTHTFVLGAQGSAFRRATWNMELEYIDSTSNKKRPKVFFGNDDDLFASDFIETTHKKKYYVLLGQILYPFKARGATLNLRTGYNFGELDSIDYKKLFYEVKLNLPVSRRLHLSSWWRESWYKIGDVFDRKMREYNITANYTKGKFYLYAEYWVIEEEDDSNKRKDRRLMIKGKRYF